ncbi:MAG: tyrosine-type recombinase/integrase [Flavobacteriales bacterium]|nr:tyrosine-type recombinase/integrase [Flavobacteriales bacterium]
MRSSFIDYLRYEKRYSAHTIKAYEKDLIEFYDYSELIQEEKDPLKLNFQQLRYYLVFLQNQDYSNRTINRKLSSLKRFYKFLLSIGEIDDNPSAKLSSLKFENKVLVPYSKKEMIRLLDEMYYDDDFEGVRDRLIINVFYSTGIRLSELMNLQVSKVDIANSQIKVLGKRNKERIIPLSTNLMNDMKTYLSYRNELQIIEDEAIFFLTKKGKQTYPNLVYSRINSYLSEVTKKVKKSPHMIRHTFATHMMDAGADLNSIKELLGHTSLIATQVYTHSSLGKLKSIVNHAHPRAIKRDI